MNSNIEVINEYLDGDIFVFTLNFEELIKLATTNYEEEFDNDKYMIHSENFELKEIKLNKETLKLEYVHFKERDRYNKW